MKRYFLSIAYKGVNYHGWQIQLQQQTVQGSIENAFEQLGYTVKIVGSVVLMPKSTHLRK